MMIKIVLLSAAIVILIIHSAFFSSSEIAYARSNKLRLKKAADAGKKTAQLACDINNNYSRTLSTVLVGNNLVNITVSSLAAILTTEILKNTSWSEYDELVATVAMALLLIIFGESLPKIIAASIPDSLALLYAYPLKFFTFVFKPVVLAVDALIKKLSPLWTPKEAQPQTTTEELCELLETIEDEGVFTEEEGDLIKSAIEFSDTTAYEILTPRVDVVAIDIDEEINLSDDLFTHSRVPVYRGSLDNILGILPTKKLMKRIIEKQEINIEEMLVPPLYVHKTKDVSSIIEEFRKKHLQMAVVVDEFGGTMGILTMEDITEEIVGDIFDERDEVTQDVIVSGDNPNSFIVDGSANIYDLFDAADYEPEDFSSEYTTVGGWATEVLDKFPEVGDSFTCGRLTITVIEAETRRVNKLKAVLAPADEEE